MFKNELKTYLLETFPDAKPASGGSHVVMRCRFCGDSADQRSRHLYIFLGDETCPPLFICFKCNEAGMLTATKMKMLTLYNDMAFLSSLEINNRKLTSLPQNRIYRDTGNAILYNDTITGGELTHAKMMYINKRLGINITEQELYDNKIVLNLYDLLNRNNIKNYTRYPNLMDQLNSSFIGFISMDNFFVNMRNLKRGQVSEAIDHKYLNYNIFGKYDTSKRFYILPNEVDLNKQIRLNIGEGSFDALSIFYNVCEKNKYQNIYGGVGGKAYLNLIKMFIIEIGLINPEIHIYIDNDITKYVLYAIYENLKIFELDIFVHYNGYTNEKDFGVPRDRIIDNCIRLEDYIKCFL